MARSLSPCGTFTAYKRHKRNGEPVDDACAQAARDQKNERKDAARDAQQEVVRLAIAESPPAPDRVDELDRLRWNLRILEATMEAGVPTGMAALSKQHADLTARIVRLEAAADGAEVSVIDQLAQRRQARLAASEG